MASSTPTKPLQKYQESTSQEYMYQEKADIWAPPYRREPFGRLGSNIFRAAIEITAGGAIIGGIAIVANAGTDTMIAVGVATGLAGFTVLTSMSASR